MLTHTGNGHYSEEDEDLAGILLLDTSLRVRAVDMRAASILSFSRNNAAGQQATARLPEEIASQLSNRSPGELNHEAVHFRSGKFSYVCRVAVLHPYHPEGETLLALHIFRDRDVPEQIHRFAAAHELSYRERQTLLGIANGLTCKQIATNLNLSPNTVKTFQRLMMAKVGVTRRGELISKVLDHEHRRQGTNDRNEGAPP